MNIPEAYKTVVHNYPTQKELQDFTPDRFISALMFLEHFLVFKANSKGFVVDNYECSEERRKEMEKFMEIPNHHFQEWIYRLDSWTGEDVSRSFFYRLRNLASIVLINLKKHPIKITPEIKAILVKYPKRMAWALDTYKIIDTGKGEIVVKDATVEDDKGIRQAPAKLPSIQLKMATALNKVADIYETIANSITNKSIVKMDIKDKLKALGSLSFIFQMAQKQAKGTHFTQININGDTKSIEKEMLNYVKKTQE